MPDFLQSFLFAVMLCLASVGCIATEELPNSPGSLLATPAGSPDSVTFEVCFVRVPSSEETQLKSLWNQVDEQAIPAEVRRQMHDNGLRCGVIGTQVPDDLRQILEVSTEGSVAEDGGLTAASESIHTSRAMQLRSGQRGEVIAGSTRDEFHLLYIEDDRLCGETFHEAQCLFAIQADPRGDGRVRLRWTPEIHFGEVRQRFIGDGGVFRMEAARESRIFETLRLDTIIAPGETMIVSSTELPKGLGNQFFVDHDNSPGEQRVLLIRLAQTQHDDRFEPVQTDN